jgi:hypothetical protein
MSNLTFGLKPYLGPQGQIVLDASPGTPLGGLAWFEYDPSFRTWRYHFTPQGSFLLIGTSGIWAIGLSSNGARWTMYRWRAKKFQANPALRNVPLRPANGGGWYGDPPILGSEEDVESRHWFQGRPLVPLNFQSKSYIAIPVRGGFYDHRMTSPVIPSGMSLMVFFPHRLCSFSFNFKIGFSKDSSIAGSFPANNASVKAMGDGDGGVWYSITGKSSLYYWRDSFTSSIHWPTPPRALSRGWNHQLISGGTSGVWLIRFGGCPGAAERACPSKGIPSRLYAFDRQTGIWREPIVPSWWWGALGAGLVEPMLNGNLLAVSPHGTIGILSTQGAMRILAVAGWPSRYTPNGLAIDSAGNAWLTAYRTLHGTHQWILIKLAIRSQNH